MTRTLQTIKVSSLRSAGNVRRSVGDVRELSYSIDRVGILNPLTARQTEDGGFELIAGHRRLAAAEKLGFETVPVYVLDDLAALDGAETVADRIALQLIENVQREDLQPLEEAEAIAELVDLLGSQKAAAEAIGRSQAHVSKRLKVRQLPEKAQEAIASGDVTLEDAFELTKIDNPAGIRKALDGLTGNGSRYELDRQLAQTDRDREDRKAARAVAGQKQRKSVEVVAVPDVEKGWKSLEGWDGLAVDQDAHEAEPCHRLVVGRQTPWADGVTETFYCSDPARHEPDGDSEVKVETTSREAEEKARRDRLAAEAEIRERRQAARWADAVTTAGGVTDRNTALKVLARWVLEQTDDAEDLLEALGAKDLPQPPDTQQAWEDRDGWQKFEAELSEAIDGLPVSILYRSAVLFVLEVTTHAYYPDRRQEPAAEAIADLLGIPVWDDDNIE